MTEFKAGEQYVYKHRHSMDWRSGQIVTITERQYGSPGGWVRGEYEDGTIGAFFADELTKKEEDVTEIKVGDTVRIKEDAGRAYYKKEGGKEFVVESMFDDGRYSYVSSEKYPGGFWFRDVEVVKSTEDTRWRYNDHLVVYPHPGSKNNSNGRRGAIILDESIPRVFERWENSPYERQGDIQEAARAYWEAHPEPKPNNYEQVEALATGTVFQFADGDPWVRVKDGVVDSIGGAKIAVPEIWKGYSFPITVIYPKESE